MWTAPDSEMVSSGPRCSPARLGARVRPSSPSFFSSLTPSRHILLLGATTENPSFRLAPALLSRLRVFVLKKLEREDVELLLRRAREKAREWGWKGEVQEELLQWIAGMADGDAR